MVFNTIPDAVQAGPGEFLPETTQFKIISTHSSQVSDVSFKNHLGLIVIARCSQRYALIPFIPSAVYLSPLTAPG